MRCAMWCGGSCLGDGAWSGVHQAAVGETSYSVSGLTPGAGYGGGGTC